MSVIHSFAPSEQSIIGDRIYQMQLPGLYFVAAHRADDFRGFYAECALIPDLEHVLDRPFVAKQVNHARSEQHVARGFHAEAWNKLITVTHGTCACVWVDLRQHSSTFGQAVTLMLGDGEGATYGSVFVEKGIGNGYVVVEGPADYVYVTDALYRERDPQFDQAISLFDPELAIQWPVPRMDMVLSQRDKQAVTLQELRARFSQQ